MRTGHPFFPFLSRLFDHSHTVTRARVSITPPPARRRRRCGCCGSGGNCLLVALIFVQEECKKERERVDFLSKTRGWRGGRGEVVDQTNVAPDVGSFFVVHRVEKGEKNGAWLKNVGAEKQSAAQKTKKPTQSTTSSKCVRLLGVAQQVQHGGRVGRQLPRGLAVDVLCVWGGREEGQKTIEKA